jgi:hypothetical protein
MFHMKHQILGVRFDNHDALGSRQEAMIVLGAPFASMFLYPPL